MHFPGGGRARPPGAGGDKMSEEDNAGKREGGLDRFTIHAMPGPDDQEPGKALYTGTRQECLEAIRHLIYKRRWKADNIALIDEGNGRYASWAVRP